MNVENLSTIVIFAEHFMGAYVWLRRPDIPAPACGELISNFEIAFPEEFGISQNLQSDFWAWAEDFETNNDKDSFDWKIWNRQGLNLAGKLKLEVGDKYLVEYHTQVEARPFSDDSSQVMRVD